MNEVNRTITDSDPPSCVEACVLALNSGSSSLKFGLYRMRPDGIDCLLSGETEKIGEANSHMHAEDAAGHTLLSETASLADHRAAVIRIGKWLAQSPFPEPRAIGHRVVHGGQACVNTA